MDDYRDLLLKERFYVPVELNEMKQVQDMHRLASCMVNNSGHITGYTIMTTTDCNARCYYCYELGRSRVSMSDKVAKDVAEYIASKSGGEQVEIQWFGGEPLYNRRVIEIITEELVKRKVRFASSMTTNGFYFDRTTAQIAREDWHLQSLQITLDGTGERYSKTKAFIDDFKGNAYEQVLDNIDGALKEGIKVNIRLNLDGSNAEDLCVLSDELVRRFGNNSNLFVYVVLLKEFAGKVHAFTSRTTATDAYLSLQKQLDIHGFSNGWELNRDFRGNCCMADNDAHVVLTPDGHIGRCEHFSETELVGSIYDKDRDLELIQEWKKLFEPFAECNECALFPGCLRLQKCEWTRFGCPEANRIVNRHNLERRVLAAYNKVKLEDENEA